MALSQAERAIENLVVLIADSNPYMRRLTRTMLTNLGARSIYGNIAVSNFYTLTTKNNPDNVPAGSNTPVYSVGSVSAPAVPEPATWAMMVGGFGRLGAATRRRSRLVSVTA